MEVAKYLVDQGEANKPMMLCEKHARMFEFIMMEHEMPHTIYELDDEEIEDEYPCMACHLDDITKPKLILPD